MWSSVIRQVQTLYWDDEPLDLTTTEKNGAYYHNDNRIQEYLDSLREDEMYQAIHRIRPLDPNGRRRINIIIASGLEIPDIEANDYYKTPMTTKTKVGHKLSTLKIAAEQLLKENFSFNRDECVTRASLIDPAVNSQFLIRNLKHLLDELELEEIPGSYRKRYGRKW